MRREDRLRDAKLVQLDDFFMRCQSLMGEAPKLGDGCSQRNRNMNVRQKEDYSEEQEEEEEFTADRV